MVTSMSAPFACDQQARFYEQVRNVVKKDSR
jgi:hypothetical protein